MPLIVFAEDSIQLIPDATLILQVLVVLGMLGILNLTLYRPINRVLEERRRKTLGRRSESNQLLASLEEKSLHYQQRLREARADGYKLLERERAVALREREEKVAALREEIGAWLAAQRSEIERQAQRARRALEAEAAIGASRITAQILRRHSSDSAV